MTARRLGLRAKFISLILIVLTIIFGLITFVVLKINSESLRNDLFERSKAFSALATKPIGNSYLLYKDSGKLLITQQITNFTKLDDNIRNVSIIDINGGVLFSLQEDAIGTTKPQAESFEPSYVLNKAGSIERVVYPLIEDSGRHSYGVVYDISSDSIEQSVQALTKLIVLYSIIGLVMSAAVTYFFINRLFLLPIKRVRDSAMLISAGHYDEQVSTHRHDEIGDLSSSVNQMAESLKADIQKLKEVDQVKTEFMMIASHNLRTPITIINGYLDIVKSQALDEATKDILNKVEANSERLSLFAEDILIISGIESGQKMFHREPIMIDGELDDMVKEFKVLADEKEVGLEWEKTKTGASILGSSIHLKSAIWNLLENALKFTAADGTITISSALQDHHIVISIKDTGTGITPDEVKKLFTKFHRGTSTTTYDYEGTGIGLYVTKLIVSEHEGTIQVDSTPGKGSNFTVSIPVLQDSEKYSKSSEKTHKPIHLPPKT